MKIIIKYWCGLLERTNLWYQSKKWVKKSASGILACGSGWVNGWHSFTGRRLLGPVLDHRLVLYCCHYPLLATVSWRSIVKILFRLSIHYLRKQLKEIVFSIGDAAYFKWIFLWIWLIGIWGNTKHPIRTPCEPSRLQNFINFKRISVLFWRRFIWASQGRVFAKFISKNWKQYLSTSSYYPNFQ